MTKKFTLQQLAELLKVEFVGNPGYEVTGVSDLDSAEPHDVSFLSASQFIKKSHLENAKASKAGIICVKEAFESEGKNFLICPNPDYAFQMILEALFGHQPVTGFEGIHPTAVIHETAVIGKNVTIGPYAVIDRNVTIEDGVYVGSGVYVGPESSIGEESLIHPHAVIREKCKLGKRVIIQPGVVIGSCGYGYTQDPHGRHIKLSHLGGVEIDDDVEIGANTAVDRGRFKSTHIGQGTKIDNLVQIAHNVSLGAYNIIVGQAGIAGSTKTGNYVMVGGQAALDGHIEICDFTMIAARSGVTKSIKKPAKLSGAPAMDINKFNRMTVLMRNLESYIDQLKEIQKKVN